jgi:hypothetical protein
MAKTSWQVRHLTPLYTITYEYQGSPQTTSSSRNSSVVRPARSAIGEGIQVCCAVSKRVDRRGCGGFFMAGLPLSSHDEVGRKLRRAGVIRRYVVRLIDLAALNHLRPPNTNPYKYVEPNPAATTGAA